MARPEVIKTIEQDFPQTVETVRKLRKHPPEGYHLDISQMTDDQILSKATWWPDGIRGQNKVIPIGKPVDYYLTRDNIHVLKSFIKRTIDKGIFTYGEYNRDDTPFDTYCYDYISWLYKATINQEYKNNIRNIVVDLLQKEFNPNPNRTNAKPIKRYWDKATKTQWNNDPEQYLNYRFKLANMFLDFSQITKEVESITTDTEFIKKFEEEAEKTKRQFIQEDIHLVSGVVRNNKEKLLKEFATGEHQKTVIYDLTKLSQEIKDKYLLLLRDEYVKNITNEGYIQHFDPLYEQRISQYDRLVGLLRIVQSIGEKNEKFAKIHQFLKQKVQEGVFINQDTLKLSQQYFSHINIHSEILKTIMVIQPENEPYDFWIQKLKTDDSGDRILLYINGLLRIPQSIKERKKIVPELLSILKDRNFFEGKTKENNGRNLIDMILEHTSDCLNNPNRFIHSLDRSSSIPSLLFFKNLSYQDKRYILNFHQFTPNSFQEVAGSYDLKNNTFSGTPEIQKLIERMFYIYGYELPNKLNVEALVGRKITDSKTFVVNPQNTDLTGQYEGVITLSHNTFVFIYDEKNNSLRLARDKDTCHVFGNSSNKQFELNKITKPVNYDQFITITQLGEQIEQICKNKVTGNRDFPFDSPSLKGKLTDDQYPPLLDVVKNLLIHQKKVVNY